MRAVVSVKDLHFSYNSEAVLSNVSFDVEEGDYLGIIGPNGSGKTTLLKLIVGYLKPKKGKIEVYGKDPESLRDRELIGYLPQIMPKKSIDFPATVKEVVLMGLLSKKKFPRITKNEDIKKAESVLSMMNILDLKDKFIGELSGGERQKVFLCRALIHEPKLLILDEPVAALDPESREDFYQLIDRLNREKEVTVIMATHDTGEIGNYAKKMLYLDRRVVFFGSFESFCKSEEMTRYFGEYSQHIICHRHDKKG